MHAYHIHCICIEAKSHWIQAGIEPGPFDHESLLCHLNYRASVNWWCYFKIKNYYDDGKNFVMVNDAQPLIITPPSPTQHSKTKW